jgi:hypothetical protein
MRRFARRQVIFSDFPKIFSFRFDPNHFYIFPVHPTEGRIAIVTDAGLDAVDARALGRQSQSQGEMNLVSEMRRARRTTLFAYGKTVWSWHPLLMLSQRRFYEPDRVRQSRQFAGDGDKTNSSPGRARHKPSNHCAGKAGVFPLNLYAHVRS